MFISLRLHGYLATPARLPLVAGSPGDIPAKPCFAGIGQLTLQTTWTIKKRWSPPLIFISQLTKKKISTYVYNRIFTFLPTASALDEPRPRVTETASA